MFDLVKDEDMKGFKIHVGIDILGATERSILDGISAHLDQCHCTKIENNRDYARCSNSYETIRRYDRTLVELKKNVLRPIKKLENKVLAEINPVINKRAEKEVEYKKSIITYKQNMEVQIAQEKAENAKKAKEAADGKRKEMEDEIARKKKVVDEIDTRMKVELDKKKAMEQEKLKKDETIVQIDREIEIIKMEIDTNPDKKDEIDKKIGNLELQRKTVAEDIKKTDVELADQTAKVKSVSTEAINMIKDIKEIAMEKESVVVAAEPPSTELPPIQNLVFSSHIKHKLIDMEKVPTGYKKIELNDRVNKSKLLELIPKEWLNIDLDNDAIKDVIKKWKKDGIPIYSDSIPGIELYLSTGIRLYQHPKSKDKEEDTERLDTCI